MPILGIFKLGPVSIMLQIWHLKFLHFLFPVKVGGVEILVLRSICLMLGGCLYAQSCAAEQVFGGCLHAQSFAAEQVFGGQHVPVAFPFFHNSFVSGDNGRMVCL